MKFRIEDEGPDDTSQQSNRTHMTGLQAHRMRNTRVAFTSQMVAGRKILWMKIT
jgi:hypothetical protein